MPRIFYLALICILLGACSQKQYAVYAPSKHPDWAGSMPSGAPVLTASTQPVASAAPARLAMPQAKNTARAPQVSKRALRSNAAFNAVKQVLIKKPVTPVDNPAPPKTNGFAIASLVLGILGLFLFYTVLLPLLAVIFGGIAMYQINQSQGQQQGRGLAIAGLVLGILGLVFAGIFWMIRIAFRI